jgi:cytoplasmic iron level regulating protein YaaA (DUF328/UPF0246 family)
MLTLLSPAKTLDCSPLEERLATTEPRFGGDIEILLKRCRELSSESLRELMSLSEPLAELNRRRFQQMRWPFTPEDARPSILAFQGDVYKRLDAASLTPDDLAWAQDRLRILSGLYGLLRPLDLIQPYRLEMGTRLSNPRGSNLYEFWGDRLADSLNAEHAERPVAAILNLASNEYMKAVPVKRLEPPVVTAIFQEVRDGQPKTIAFLAKKARGMMARFVVQERIEEPEGLREFCEEGYGFRADLSDDGRYVFTRPDSRAP